MSQLDSNPLIYRAAKLPPAEVSGDSTNGCVLDLKGKTLDGAFETNRHSANAKLTLATSVTSRSSLSYSIQVGNCKGKALKPCVLDTVMLYKLQH